MKLFKQAKLLASLLAFFSMAAHASIINVSGYSFNDLGGSTIDMTSNLEWRDMHLTNGRSQCSVSLDIGGSVPSGCYSFDGQDLIGNSEGWRYATRSELASMLTRWMGVSILPNGYFAVDIGLNQLFRDTFADGSSYIRPDFYPDTANIYQAVGFSSIDASIYMDYYNGDVNGSCCGQGSVLVRDAQQQVPEPASLALLGLAGLACMRRRKPRAA